MQIVKAPSPLLRGEAKIVKKVTPAIVQTIKEMVKLTKNFVDPEGVGLAAPQVGISEQFFIAKFENNADPAAIDGFSAIINPKVINASKREKMFLEGCLSIPDYYGEITRPTWVEVSFLNIEGQQIHLTIKGVNAFIFQHENDHLHGRLFMDLVMSQHAKLFKVVGKDKAGADIFEEVTL